jgi:hypothetical protein
MNIAPTRESSVLPAPDPLEVLIKEARRRGRRHLTVIVAALVVVAAGTSLGLWMSGGATGGHTKKPSPTTAATPAKATAFLHLAAQGQRGNYEATYVITGSLSVYPGPRWRLVVANQSPIAGGLSRSFPGGHWSYTLHASDNFSVQWIENGSQYVACWRSSAQRPWRCGQGVNEGSNNFIESTVPFVPSTIARDVLDAVPPPWGAGAYAHMHFFYRSSSSLGRLTCMSASGQSEISAGRPNPGSTVTWCLTSRGIPASVDAHKPPFGDGWESVRLVSLRPASSADFRPLGAPRLNGGPPPI